MVRRSFVTKKVKNTVPWTCENKSIGTFYEKELKKANQKEFRIENVIKKKKTSYMSNKNVMTFNSIVGLIKKTLFKMSQYFSTLINHMNPLEETSVSKLIYLIMQQKLI